MLCSRAVCLSLAVAASAACGRAGFDPIAFDAGVDSDGDGAVDVTDNCPMLANPSQHDEDLDQIGDACDPCPHLAGDSADDDLDGVGDACDPAPTTAGNSLLAFLTFEDPVLPPQWAVEVTALGTWTIESDAFVVVLPTDRVARLTASVTNGDVTIDTRVTIDAIAPDAGSTARNIALIDNYAPAPDTGLFFGMVQDYAQPPATAVILTVLNGVSSGVLAGQAADTTLRLSSPYRLRYSRTGDGRALHAEGSEGTFDLSADLPDTGGQWGLRARGVTARFHYLLIIR